MKEKQEIKNSPNWLWLSFSVVWKILVVLGVLGFLGWRLVNFGQTVWDTRQEIIFAWQHPDLVQPVREIYARSHQQADTDLKQILNGGK